MCGCERDARGMLVLISNPGVRAPVGSYVIPFIHTARFIPEVELYQSRFNHIDRRETHIRHICHMEWSGTSPVGCHLTGEGGQGVDTLGPIGKTHRGDTCKALQPGTGRCIPAEEEVEMISVAVEIVPQPGLPGILNGRAAGHHQDHFGMYGQRLLYRLADAVIHGLLVAAIVGITAMGGVHGIRPGHMVSHLNIWVGTECRSIGEELGYAGLKSAVQPRLRTGLLNGDIVPGLILHECSQR